MESIRNIISQFNIKRISMSSKIQQWLYSRLNKKSKLNINGMFLLIINNISLSFLLEKLVVAKTIISKPQCKVKVHNTNNKKMSLF